MIDFDELNLPDVLKGITSTTEDLELTMRADMRFGSLLRVLAASTAGGRILQLRAGSGLLTAWLLDGMPADGTLLAGEPDAELHRVAERFLGRDGRLELRGGTPDELLDGADAAFSLVVCNRPADCAGRLDEIVRALRPGGLLVIGGVTDGPDASGSGSAAAAELADGLAARQELRSSRLDWAAGVLLAARRGSR